jgi:hypothetical protein
MWKAIKDYAEVIWMIGVLFLLAIVVVGYTWWTGKEVILDEDT